MKATTRNRQISWATVREIEANLIVREFHQALFDETKDDMELSKYESDAKKGIFPAQLIIKLVQEQNMSLVKAHYHVKCLMADVAAEHGDTEKAKQIREKAELEKAYFTLIDRF